jgi:hypothetical protein
VDQSLVNAKILHDEAIQDMGFPTVTTKQFHLRVAEGLVKGSRKPKLPRPPPGPIQSHCSSIHLPERSIRRKMCVLVGGTKAITMQGEIMIFFASYVAIAIASNMQIYELVLLYGMRE